jgi:hypothetical protein
MLRCVDYFSEFGPRKNFSMLDTINIDKYTRYTFVMFSCYLHPNDAFTEYGTVFNGTIKYGNSDNLYYFNPGICKDCMYNL